MEVREPLFPIWVRQNRRTKCGFIDRHGRLAIEPRFDDGHPSREGRMGVRVGKYWGFVDTSGRTVVEPVYSCVFLGFQGGVAQCSDADDAETVFIDREGRTLFRAPQYGRDQGPHKQFHEGLAAICDGMVWGYMNFSGEWVIPPQFQSAGDSPKGSHRFA